MTTFKINAIVPTPTEVVASLDVEKDTGLTLAREALATRRRELDRAALRLADATVRVDQLKRDILVGRAGPADLEHALREQQVCALVLPQHQDRVDDAGKTIVVALKHAKASVVAEAGRRRDGLQATADKIAPVLEGLKLAEGALDALLTQVAGEPACVEAVTWPGSLEADAVISHGRQLSGSVGVPVSLMYPRAT
jgi:hypothetical protein